MKRFLIILGTILLYAFATIGLFFTSVFVGMHFGWLNVKGSISERNSFFSQANASTPPINTVGSQNPPCDEKNITSCDWNQTPEWSAIKTGLQKDAQNIEKVSTETGIPSRIIASVVVPEQTRFFTANREIFKSYFEPLKILGSMTQFSLGISGIKQDTANNIEKYANDPTSVFYPGEEISKLISYDSKSVHDVELYGRLTDSKNHYYQYLYTAIYIKEIEAQWSKKGFNILNNPQAIATLFNIGFQGSHPNNSPKAGGSTITTGGKIYLYGELGNIFYNSNELIDIFPNSLNVNSINLQ